VAGDPDGSPVHGDPCAERVHAAEGAMAIAGSSEVAEFADTFREGGKQGVAMRYGFVTGRFDTTGEGVYGVEDLFLHDGESWFQFNMRRFVVGWMQMEIPDFSAPLSGIGDRSFLNSVRWGWDSVRAESPGIELRKSGPPRRAILRKERLASSFRAKRGISVRPKSKRRRLPHFSDSVRNEGRVLLPQALAPCLAENPIKRNYCEFWGQDTFKVQASNYKRLYAGTV
jgi:hypothetical protein